MQPRSDTVTQRTKHRRPAVVAFDVVGTLFSLEPLRLRLTEAGFPETALAEWFSRFLHAAVSLDLVDVFKPFRDVAIATLEVMAAEHRLASSTSTAQKIIQGLSELPAYPDVRPSFQGLLDAGIRIVALTNGSAQTTQHLLKQAALETFVEGVVSIDEVRHWKPRTEVYLHAANVAGVPPVRMCLVAAHAWDILGAKHAGLLTAWVARKEKKFHTAMQAPDVTGDSLTDVVAKIVDLPLDV
jgi:2-haloacid dehalogenase